MQERFSDRARHAMALANLEAARLKHDYLSPAHLMLGLIAEGNCVATETLRLLDVDLGRVRNEVQALLKEGSDDGSVGRRAHTKTLKDVIHHAIQEARASGHQYVGTEHLILGILACNDSIPSKVLRQQGLELQTLRDKTLAVLKSDIDPAHDLAHSRHGTFEWVHQQELAKAFRSATFWHTMILAVDSANRAGAAEVEPQHLLMALLREPSGLNDALAAKGVTADWLKDHMAPSEPPVGRL